jgi:hypothetical protein
MGCSGLSKRLAEATYLVAGISYRVTGRRVCLASRALDLYGADRGLRRTPLPSQSGHGGGRRSGLPNWIGRISTSCPVPKHFGQVSSVVVMAFSISPRFGGARPACRVHPSPQRTTGPSAPPYILGHFRQVSLLANAGISCSVACGCCGTSIAPLDHSLGSLPCAGAQVIPFRNGSPRNFMCESSIARHERRYIRLSPFGRETPG